MIKRHLHKLLVLAFISAIINVAPSGAYYSDSKTLPNNSISAACWTPPTTPEISLTQFVASDLSSTFSFSASQPACNSDPLFYTVQISSTCQFNNPTDIHTIDKLSQNYFQYDFPSLGDYCWRVMACSGQNCSPYSAGIPVHLIDPSAIVSQITTNFSRLAKSYLSTFSSLSSFRLDYSLNQSDQTLPTQLCYSHQLSDFKCPPKYISTSGNFNFEFDDGPGLYLFDTLTQVSDSLLEPKDLNPLHSFILSHYSSVNYLPTTFSFSSQTPQVLLNSIDFNSSVSDSVQLFNRSPFDLKLNDYYISLGAGDTQSLPSTTISANSSANFYMELPDDSATISLFSKSSAFPIDTTTYQSTGSYNQVWTRIPDATGDWYLITPDLLITPSFNTANSILSLDINNLPLGTQSLDYRIYYSTQGIAQEITGTISSDLFVKAHYLKQEFLGTCSDLSCVAHPIDDNHIGITIQNQDYSFDFL